MRTATGPTPAMRKGYKPVPPRKIPLTTEQKRLGPQSLAEFGRFTTLRAGVYLPILIDCVREKKSVQEMVRHHGQSTPTITKWDRWVKGSASLRDDIIATMGEDEQKKFEKDLQTAPVELCEQLDDEHKRMLRSFSYFNEKVFGEKLYPYQEEWIKTLLTEEHSMVLAPPRHGKTEVFSVRLPCWLLAGGGMKWDYYDEPTNPLRDAQVLLYSDTEGQAKKNFLAIEARLLGKQMVKHFGRFRDQDSPWRPSDGTCIVSGRRREYLSGDFSLVCAGGKSAVLGRGAGWILIDDPARITNCRTPEQTEEIFLKLRTEVFSRLEILADETAGHVMCMGAHLPVPMDLYTRIRNIPLTEDEEYYDEVLLTEDEDIPRLFVTITQPAVLDWANKLLLSEKPTGRYDWPAMMKIRSRVGEHAWEATYMQNPASSLISLCAPEWIMGTGGFVGCLDHDRKLGESREQFVLGDRAFPMERVVSVDPSPTQYAGVIAMDIPVLGSGEYRPVLFDIERGILPTVALCDLLTDWWYRYSFTTLVIEKNAAHAIMQSSDYQQFLHTTGVKVIQHVTSGQTKNHQLYGKSTIADDVMRGYIRIPYGDLAARTKFMWLINELLERVGTDDTVMSLWFPKWSLQGLTARRSGTHWTGMGVTPQQMTRGRFGRAHIG